MLEKILEEIIEQLKAEGCIIDNDAGNRAEEIIRKHMNDGWIPVEVTEPPLGNRLEATIKHHKWISDHDSDWVSENEKIVHPERTEVCEIVSIGAQWFYSCREDDYQSDVAYINPTKDLSRPISEIIAWREKLEPYCPEKGENNGSKI